MASTNRQQIDELKGKVKKLRCYDRLLDAIGECIGNFADRYADELEVSAEILQIATEELVYNETIDDEDIEWRLEEV